MNSRRFRDQVVVPYPFLNDPTNLAVSGIANTYTALPTTFEPNKWYRAPANRVVNVPANITLLVIRDRPDNRQNIIWAVTPANTAVDRELVANDYVIFLTQASPVITVAGFDLFSLVDVPDTAVSAQYLTTTTNIKFNFTLSA